MSTLRSKESGVPKMSAITEWSITISAGASGLILSGSPPISAIASRMVARSTMHGTPVKSCITTRAGVNWISWSGSADGSQFASARMWSAVMSAPSSVRRRFSSRTLRLKGSFSLPSTASSRKMSYSVPSTSSVARAPKLSLLAATACASPSLVLRASCASMCHPRSSQPRAADADQGHPSFTLGDQAHRLRGSAGRRSRPACRPPPGVVRRRRRLASDGMTPGTGTATTAAAAVPSAGGTGRYRLARRLLTVGLLVAFLATCLDEGLPTDRVVLLTWVLAALAVQSLGRGWRALVRLLVDWVPLVAVLLLYDLSRGLA